MSITVPPKAERRQIVVNAKQFVIGLVTLLLVTTGLALLVLWFKSWTKQRREERIVALVVQVIRELKPITTGGEKWTQKTNRKKIPVSMN